MADRGAKIFTVIRRKMAQLGLNQAALAARVSEITEEPIGSAAVGRWVRGETMPGVERVRALSQIFGLTIDQLHGLDEMEGRAIDHVIETHVSIDDYLQSEVTRRLNFDQRISPLVRVRHQLMPLRPDLVVENDKGMIFAVFVFQGGQHAAYSVIGAAELWRQTRIDVPFYALWVQQGATGVNTELLGECGLLEGLDCAQAADVPDLIEKGELFADFLKWCERAMGYSRKTQKPIRKGSK